MQRLPKDVQEIVLREFTQAGKDERADIAQLTASLQKDLSAKGMKFIEPNRDAFRDTLKKTSFYKDWRGKLGDEGWKLLEESSGAADMTAEATTPPGLDFAVERPLLKRAERWLAAAVGIPAAVAVLAEVGVLLYGVIMRFVFNNPLVWSDELAGMIFLWLAMLGSVLALWNGEHMRLTTVSSRLPPRWRALADTLAVAAPCLFLIFVIGPALDFMEDQSFVETPALGWPDSVRAAALPTGCALMLVLCVLRLLQHRLREVVIVAAVLGVIAAAFGSRQTRSSRLAT